MNNLLRSVGLIEDLQLELNISKEEFQKAFTKYVEKGAQGSLKSLFRQLTNTQKKFEGEIDNDGAFWIRRSPTKSLYRRQRLPCIAAGSYQKQSDRLLVKIELNALYMNKPFLVFTFVILLCAIGHTLLGGELDISFMLWIFAFIFTTLSYIAMRAGIAYLKHHITNEFTSWTDLNYK